MTFVLKMFAFALVRQARWLGRLTVCCVLCLVVSTISSAEVWARGEESRVEPTPIDQSERFALIERQQTLFDQMLIQPDNVALMYEYARVSVRLEDFEAAISTLTRLNFYRPNSAEVAIELGAAYFRIGSYPVARFYFEEAQKNPSLSAELNDRIEAFLDQIDRRTSRSKFNIRLDLSALATTNANNAPSTDLIEFLGLIVRLEGDDVTAQADYGASFSIAAQHSYDLQLKRDHAWLTDFTFYSARYANTRTGAVDVAEIRTGPSIALEDESFSARLRPYIEADYVRSAQRTLYGTIGFGADYYDTINPLVAVFGDFRIGWRDFRATGFDGRDGARLRSRAGFTFFANDQLTLRTSGVFEFSDAGDDFRKNVEFGLSTLGVLRYSSDFSSADRPWSVSLMASALRRKHFDPDPIAGVVRADVDLRLILGHSAYLTDSISLNAQIEYFNRLSNSQNFEFEALTARMGFSYQF